MAKIKERKDWLPRRGEVIELDCGYGGIERMAPCKLLEDPVRTSSVFGTPMIIAWVQLVGTGETFTAVLGEDIINA